MRLIRFMGAREMCDYLIGRTLTNNTDWRGAGGRSTSKGFCFFPADPPADTPEERLHYISGVVTFDRIMEFEAPDDLPGLRLSWGTYRNPDNKTAPLPGLTNFVFVNEYCIESYNRDILPLIKYGRVIWDKTINYWKIEWLFEAVREPWRV